MKRIKDPICTSCGTKGKPKVETPGSIFIEIILWLCFIIPGLIYSIWRGNKRNQVCRGCGSDSLVPSSSPMGKKMIEGS